MIRINHLVLAALLSLGSAAALQAQDGRSPAQDPAAATPQEGTLGRYLKRVPELDQGGGLHLTKYFAVVFGDIKSGSGIALGPALSVKFADGGYAQVKAEYSLRRFRLLQARYDSPEFLGGHALISSRVRWQDAPKLSLFQLGPASPLQRAEFGERRTEASLQLEATAWRVLHVTAGGGIERYATSGGRIDLAEDESLPAIPMMPGLGARPWFGHSFLSVALDTQPSGYARAGTVIDAGIHDFHDAHDGTYSFRRVEAGAEHLIPFGRSTVDLAARTWFSYTEAGKTVPFFLMPTLGGGDYLEAYRLYRFRDRNAAWVKGEYRFALHEFVDVAGFYEAGQVAPSPGTLTLARAAQSAGAGVIFHGKTSARLRFDVARGREGYGAAIGFSAGGS
ncbi:MAG TPA: hypothetical protein VL225_13585 [Vicinamibacterales bacterium]|nr:hypothetical protein [Vicinamibacterales bacterium]